ncbi:MAG: PKD domain-containing protein [Saprospiraceae bacterium]|nr:PKD domain-containing protein [Saprospiraceae bacterium]
MKKLILSALCLVGGFGIISAQPFNNPTITTCNGVQFYCITGPLEEVCVNIIVDPNDPNKDSIVYFEITWGDNSPNTIVPGSPNPGDQTHTYNLSSFFGSCKFQESYTIILQTYLTDTLADPTNSAFILTFRNPPVAFFAMSSNPCANEGVTFQGSVVPGGGGLVNCPVAGISYEVWDLGDGQLYTGDTLGYVFENGGTYNISYCVGNVCDTVCSSSTITVSSPPDAVINPTTNNAINILGNEYNICMGDSLEYLQLTGANSFSSNSFSWNVEGPAGGWQWYPDPEAPDTNIVAMQFSQPGQYKIYLRVTNTCIADDDAQIIVNVIKPPSVQLQAQGDTCTAIAYTPIPLDTAAVYTINGIEYDSFPVFLPLSNNFYFLEAEMKNFCGEVHAYDTFALRTASNIAIAFPNGDVTACINSDTIKIFAFPAGAWFGPSGSFLNDSTGVYFIPNTVGEFEVITSIGIGVCRRADTIHFTVELPLQVALDTPSLACLETEFTPTPFDSTLTYEINGIITDSFPINLDAAFGPYLITAYAGNSCGLVSKSVVSELIAPEDVEIFTRDTFLCSGTDRIYLEASDTLLGFWEGEHIFKNSNGYYFDPVMPGSYLLVFVRGFDLCRRIDSITVNVAPGNAVEAGEDLAVCDTEQTIQLTNTSPGGFFSGFAINGDVVDVTQLTIDTPYQFTYTNPTLPDACNHDTRTLTVYGPPNAGFELDKDTVCSGETVRVIPNATSGVVYLVNWGDGTSGFGLLNHEFTAPGVYPVQYTAFTVNPLTGEPLCTITDSARVEVPSAQIPGTIRFEVFPDSGCAPLTVYFNNQSPNDGRQYVWDLGNGQTYYGYNPPPVTYYDGVTDTAYQVRVRMVNGCGAAEYEQTIKVAPRPRAVFEVDFNEPCSGSIATLSLGSYGNPLQHTYYVSNGHQYTGSFDQPTQFQLFTGDYPETVGIMLVSSNLCGSDTAFQQLIVHPPDVTALAGLPDTTRLCEGVLAQMVNFASPGAEIAWEVSTGEHYSGDTILVHFPEPGQYFITLFAYGCGYDSVKLPITVYPLPDIELIHDEQNCPGEPVNFWVNSVAPGIQLWFGDGDSTWQRNIAHRYTIPGAYTPFARAITQRGCESTTSGSLIIHEWPTAQATTPDSVCTFSSIHFQGSSNHPQAFCSWQFGDGTSAEGCFQTYAYSAQGNYSAILIVTSPEGCLAADTVAVMVRTIPEAQFAFNLPQACAPATALFLSQATGATTVKWTISDGYSSDDFTFERTFDQPGSYSATFYTLNDGICPDTAHINFEILHVPDLKVNTILNCTAALGTDLVALTAPQNFLMVNGPNYNATGSEHRGLLPGSYTISAESNEGCVQDTMIQVLPINELQLGVEEDYFSLVMGELAPLSAKVNKTDVDFLWEPAIWLSDSSIANPVSRPIQPVIYTVTATDNNGCTKTDTVRIDLSIDYDATLFIPNAFTPNDDGVNDVFYLRSNFPEALRINYFRIFDKYNETVFDIDQVDGKDQATPEDRRFGWDGQFRGDKAEAGSYRATVSVTFPDGVVRAFTGTVQLIR